MSATNAANVSIEIGPQDTVLVKPLCYLGYPKFDEYQERCRAGGCEYDPDETAYRAPRHLAVAIYEAMRSGGFTVDVDVRLKEVMAAARARQEAKETGGEAHLARIELALRERDLSLYPFQRRAVQWLFSRDRALLGDEMGIGKTPELLCSLPANARALICVPASLKYMWKNECKLFRPDLTPVVLKGRASFRWPESGEAVIFNYELLPSVRKRGRRLEIDPEEWPNLIDSLPHRVHLVADEAHYLKNGKAKRSQKFRTLSQAILKKDGTTWLATGTPMMRAPTDLWHVLRAASLELDAFKSWPYFCKLFRAEKGDYGYEWGEPDPSVPELLKRVMLRRLRIDVLPDLPPKQRHVIPVDGINRETRKACDEVLEALDKAGVELTWAVLNTDLSEDTLIFQKMAAARAALATAKIKHMQAIVDSFEEQQEPLVVFCSHRAPIDLLGERPGWAKIVGGVDPEERARIVKEFQAGRLNGVAATIGAGGVGLTLTRANHMLQVQLDFNPASNHQAEDRICRVGQEADKVCIHIMVADHELDERVTQILIAKQKVIEASMKPTEDAHGNEYDHLENSA
jgi:SWI/SNF-related matrix-associated actin-dependent regulator 1 of chromatin subfamily A